MCPRLTGRSTERHDSITSTGFLTIATIGKCCLRGSITEAKNAFCLITRKLSLLCGGKVSRPRFATAFLKASVCATDIGLSSSKASLLPCSKASPLINLCSISLMLLYASSAASKRELLLKPPGLSGS